MAQRPFLQCKHARSTCTQQCASKQYAKIDGVERVFAVMKTKPRTRKNEIRVNLSERVRHKFLRTKLSAIRFYGQIQGCMSI